MSLVAPFKPQQKTLEDRFGRRIDYLRVSITDRCDLRCSYCLPADYQGAQEPAHWLHADELLRLVQLFVGMGVSKLRLTGGEPLTRRSLLDIVRGMAALPGVKDLSLSTNATQLDRYAQDLRLAGVQRLNISLDTLSAPVFERITGRNALGRVLEGIRSAREAGFAQIKLNMVVQEGVNAHEAPALLAYALQHGLLLRLIEAMPMGLGKKRAQSVDVTALARRLATDFALLPRIGMVEGGQFIGAGPARYWQTAEGAVVLGAITPMSEQFCASCNRVRLTADGTLYLCLGQELTVPLGAMLRAGASDADLCAAIEEGIARKPERHEFKEQPEKIVRLMAYTGG